MIRLFEKYPIASLSVIVLVMLLIHLNIPSITIMEARNFITAKEMITDHHWLLTTMNGEPRYQKPPLPTWLSAISALIFGINSVFALRLPAALMVLFLGIMIYYISKELKFNTVHSFNNALISVTSFYIIGIINEAPWDIYTHGFMLAGIFYLFRFFQSKQKKWHHVLLSSIFVGLSILSKGPVSLYALFLPFIIAYGITFKFGQFKKGFKYILVWLLAAVLIGGWWFVYVRLADPIAFLKIANKETGNWHSYNVKPFFYYWNFFIQSGIWTIPAFISLLYPFLIKKIKNKIAYQFTFWWTISSVILLSLIPEKKARYLMPTLIPLALNTGFYINYIIEEFKNITNKKITLPIYFNFGLIGLIGLFFPIIGLIRFKNKILEVPFSFGFTSLFLIIIGLFIFINLKRKAIASVFYLTIAFIATILVFGLPITKVFQKKENFNAIYTLHNFENTHKIKTYSVKPVTPELLWNYQGKLKNIFQKNELIKPKESKFGLLILNEDVNKIKNMLNVSFNLKHITTYNLNVGAKNKERLIRQFYLVTKK